MEGQGGFPLMILLKMVVAHVISTLSGLNGKEKCIKCFKGRMKEAGNGGKDLVNRLTRHFDATTRSSSCTEKKICHRN